MKAKSKKRVIPYRGKGMYINPYKGKGLYVKPYKGRGCKRKFFTYNKMKRRRGMLQRKRGKGILNTIIDHLPVSLHVPGYNYCGPGTKLRGQPAVNKLDEYCKQ